MNANINGTVARKLYIVGGRNYKLANQCLYPANERTQAVAQLEMIRAYKMRVKITSNGTVMRGYIRHTTIDGNKFPQLFSYKNSTKGKEIPFPIDAIEWRGISYYNREQR
jgi:hypothetical protein